MNKILSVVVPSYNAASYLEETIPTLLATRYNEQLELMIVNDGSKDNTLEIANAFAQQYPNTIKVIDKENGGHGSTINAGIQQATGKYFKVIDADDWINSAEFERLIEYLHQVDVDQVISPYNEVYVDSNEVNEINYLPGVSQEIFDYTQLLEKVGIVPQMHSLTIRTSILKENNIHIGEKMFYVDTEYIIYPMPFVKQVAFFNAVVYQYRLGTLGQSVHISNYVKNRNMLKNVMFNIIRFAQSNEKQLGAKQKQMIDVTIYGMISLLVNAYLAMEDVSTARKEYQQFKRELFELDRRYWEECQYKKVSLLKMTKDITFSLLSWYTRKVVYRG